MGQIIKKNLHSSNFFAVLICNKAESSILCSRQRFSNQSFAWTTRQVRIWSKMKNISYHCQEKKKKALEHYRDVDTKIPERSGAGTNAGTHTQREQRGWRRRETFSAKKQELTHPTLRAWRAPAQGFCVCRLPPLSIRQAPTPGTLQPQVTLMCSTADTGEPSKNVFIPVVAGTVKKWTSLAKQSEGVCIARCFICPRAHALLMLKFPNIQAKYNLHYFWSTPWEVFMHFLL